MSTSDEKGWPLPPEPALKDVDTNLALIGSDFFTQIFNCSAEILLVVDPSNLHIVMANRHACKVLGYSHNELMKHRITDIERSMEEQFFWDEIAENANQPAPSGILEGLYQCRNGTQISVEKLISRVRSSRQDLIVLTARDTSYHKTVEKDLAHLTSQLRTTLEATADGILVVNLEGKILNFNHTFSRLWNLPDTLLLQHDDLQILKWIEARVVDKSAFRERLATLVAEPELSGSDILTLLDGRVYECYSKPQYLGEQVIGRVYSFSDITQRKHDERELILARDEALRANSAKSEFLSQMSHELRTPLTSIRGSLGLLAKGLVGPLPTRAKELVLLAERNSTRLIMLINDILDMEKVSSGKMDFTMCEQLLKPLLEQAIEANQPYADQYTVKLILAQCDDALMIFVDEHRFIQVLNNLISNAVKFSPAQASVDLSATVTEKNVRIAVQDRGQGIPEKFQDKIFSKFSQADTSDSRRNYGSGLGLSICKHLVENMHGTIGFETQLGQGTKFYVDLPIWSG